MKREVTQYFDRRVAVEAKRAAFEYRTRVLADIEKISGLHLRIEWHISGVNRLSVNRDVDCASLRRDVKLHDAAAFRELTPPHRNAAKMVGFETGIGVPRVKVISRRSRHSGRRDQRENARCNQLLVQIKLLKCR